MRIQTSLLALLAAVILGVGVGPARAQQPKGPPDPETRVRWMSERLDLTEAQADRVRGIFEEQDRERQEIFAEGPSPETRERMMDLRQRTHERLADVLDEQQMERLREMAPRGPFDRQGPGRPLRGEGPGPRGCSQG